MSSSRPALSLLIVSTVQFCDRLKLAIPKLSKKSCDDLVTVKLAENLEDILNSPQPKTEVDFVAIVIDTSLPEAVEKCKNEVSHMMPLFVASRICLVNGSCKNCSLETVRDLENFADNFGIPYFNGNIMDNLSCRETAERILKFAKYTSGFEYGIPGIIPTPGDLFDVLP